MRLLLTILLFTGTVQAQSIDSIITVRFAKMLSDSLRASDARYQKAIKDSLKASETVLDSSQFEIVKGIVHIKSTLLQKSVNVVPVQPGVNLLTYSDQFDNAVWEKTNGSSVIADQTGGIDSNKSGDLFSASSVQWGNMVRRTFAFANQKYTQTVYLKRNNWDYIGIRIANSMKGAYYPFVNLSTLETNNQGIAGCTITAEQLPDSIVKVTLTFITAAGNAYYDIAVVNSTGNSAAVTKGTEKVYMVAAQLNPGDPGAYVRTTKQAAQ